MRQQRYTFASSFNDFSFSSNMANLVEHSADNRCEPVFTLADDR